MTPTLQHIAFIGLGRMGGPMARHLLAAGFRVTGFDLDAAATARHQAAGGVVAGTPADAARGADMVITMLNSDGALRSVATGPDGLLGVVSKPQIYIDMSTSMIPTVHELAPLFAVRSVPMLDAPVSGGTHGAEAATLDVMVGGDEAAFEQCRPVLAAMSRKATYVGISGSGQLAKYVNQIVMAATFCAAAEGLALAAKGGADPGKVYEAISTGLSASPLLAMSVKAIFADAYGEGAELTLFQKDTAYALDAATSLDAWLPVTTQTHDLFTQALRAGFGGGGAMGVAQLWEQVMGVRLQPHTASPDETSG